MFGGTASRWTKALREISALRVVLYASVLLVVFIMAFPTSVSTGVGLVRLGTAPAPVSGHVATPLSHLAAVASHAGGIAGANPIGQSYINAPQLGRLQALQRSHWAFQPGAGVTSSSTHSSPTPPALPTNAVPRPGISIQTGVFTGYINDSVTGLGVSGVTVQAYSLGTAICPATPGYCVPVTSNATGYFSAVCPIGQDYVQFTADNYMPTVAYGTGRNATTIYLGTTYLVHDGYVRGIIVGDDGVNFSQDPRVSSVTVSVSSLAGTVSASPVGVSTSNGSFVAAAPPVPSKVDFQPLSQYVANFTFVNVSPYQTVNLGFIFVEPNLGFKAELYDAVTGNSIGTGGVNSLQVCSTYQGGCGISHQGPSSGSNVVTAEGPVGYDYLVIEATGYVGASIPIPFVAKHKPTGLVDLGPFFLAPTGVFSFGVGVTHKKNTTLWDLSTAAEWTATVCSMDGYQMVGVVPNLFGPPNTTEGVCWGGGCVPWDTGFLESSTPLRVDVQVAPDYRGICNPPTPTWPIPGQLPVWGNETAVNVTPYEVTSLGWVNMTPGSYIYGNVSVLPGTSPPQFGYTVRATSQQYLSTIYGYIEGGNNSSPWSCQPFRQVARSFCVPAPPGADLITASSNGYADNFTWGSAPFYCCASSGPIPLNEANTNQLNTINFTAPGQVVGVVQNLTGAPLALAAVTVAPAGQLTGPTYYAITNFQGRFDTYAPSGWVQVTASASGYSPTTSWAFINGTTSIGNLTLTPVAILTGRVIDPHGNSVLDAYAKWCKLSSPLNGCQPLGAGRIATSGIYLGEVPGGWLPWSTYEIEVTASGYSTDWVWANATPGQATVVPTIVLFPVGNGSLPAGGHGGAGAPRPAAAAPTSAYITGRLVDLQTGWGIPTGASNLQACQVSTSNCFAFTLGSNTGGFFNQSVPSGLYDLFVNPDGYHNTTVYFNASGAGFVNVGTISLNEFSWILGDVSVHPWNYIYHIVLGTNPNGTPKYALPYHMGPTATVKACDASGVICSVQQGSSEQVGPVGQYMISTPGGINNVITAVPIGGGYTSSNGGLNANSTHTNATSQYTNLTEASTINLDIFSVLTVSVRDNTTQDRDPVRYASVTAQVIGAVTGTAAGVTGGGGNITFIIPANAGKNNVTVSAFTFATETASEKVGPNLVPGVNYTAHNLSLVDYGFAQVKVTDSATGLGVPYARVGAVDTLPTATYATSGAANGDGVVNLTSAPGRAVVFSVVSSNDINGTVVTGGVNSSETTYLVQGSPLALGAMKVDHWGWAMSQDLNTTMAPNLATVVDKVKGIPVPYVNVLATSNDPIYQGAIALTSWSGQFLVDAPIGTKDVLSAQLPLYYGNITHLSIRPGQTFSISEINITGDGVIAGQVVANPGGAPVAGASITACVAAQRVCGIAVTNQSGVFWVNATPGRNWVNVSATGFVTNGATIVQVCSDCFVGIGPITLDSYSGVYGTARGLPSGFLLKNASVQICSPLGNPTGACQAPVFSQSNGQFIDFTPPGKYILAVSDPNAPGYNTSYLPLSLSPGERVNVGIIYLAEYGTLGGSVYSAASQGPLSGASVLACPKWAGGNCTGPVLTNAAGLFTLSGPPGPYEVTVSANGFADAYGATKIAPGMPTTMPTIYLQPIGANVYYTVSGRVVAQSDTSKGLGGAIVSLLVNGTSAFSAVADSTGAFTLHPVYGSYVLRATLNGYMPHRFALTVHSPIPSLTIPLGVMTYNVTGTVRDAYSHQVVTSVSIEEFNQSLTLSDSNGQFSVALPNGTHELLAVPPPATSVQYGPVPFEVTVAGSGFVHDLMMYPPSVMVFGLLVDAGSGLPITNVLVTVHGTVTNGPTITQTVMTDAAGIFELTVPSGTYVASAQAPGYSSGSVSVVTDVATVHVTLALQPTTTGSSPSAVQGTSGLLLLGGLVAAGSAVLLVGALVYTRRRRPPSTRPAGAAAGKRAP